MARRVAVLALWSAMAGLVWPSVASAHAFAIGREDVPIPIWLFLWAAAAVLVASFAALSAGWRTTRLEREHWRPVPQAISRVLINPATEVICGVAGVALLGLVVWSGLYGTNVAEINFSVTFVFITFWIGGVLVSVLVGNVYRAFNPWRAIARAGAFALSLSPGRRATPPLSYPERLGRWPAAAGLVAFVMDGADLRSPRAGGDAACHGRRGPHLHGVHPDRNCAVRHRAVGLPRRDLLGLLRDVLRALPV